MRMQPPTDEQRARDADLTAKVQASIAEFEALPDIDKAVHRLDQKRSGIHGLTDFDSPLTKEQRDAIIDRFPEFVVLRAYRDARADVARLTAERDDWKRRVERDITKGAEARGLDASPLSQEDPSGLCPSNDPSQGIVRRKHRTAAGGLP